MDSSGYTYWRPNKSVERFFNAVKERKVARPLNSTYKITNSSAPETDGYSKTVKDYLRDKKIEERKEENQRESNKKQIQKRIGTSAPPSKRRKISNSSAIDRDLEDIYF